jgi:murein DD-endopeptidase MepM/ murein hydrolase activator NlpD
MTRRHATRPHPTRPCDIRPHPTLPRATRPRGATSPGPGSAARVPARGAQSRRPDRRRRHGAAGAVLLLAVLTTITASTVVAADATGVPQVPVRSATGVPLPDYRLPVDGAPVLRRFEAPPAPWSAGHRGVDLAVAVATVVTAPAGGVVTFAGPVAGRGVVTVRHDDGLLSSLEPLTASVRVGDRVSAAEPLGTLTAGDHCPPASCLHWGVRTAPDAYVDPLVLVTPAGPVVLLPP